MAKCLRSLCHVLYLFPFPSGILTATGTTTATSRPTSSSSILAARQRAVALAPEAPVEGRRPDKVTMKKLQEDELRQKSEESKVNIRLNLPVLGNPHSVSEP